MKELNIFLSKYFGPCHGVSRALTQILEYKSKLKIFGEIAHNDILMKKIRENKNLDIIESVSEISDGDSVAIRTHGITLEDLEYIKKKRAKIFDQTCNNVKFVQNLAEKCEKNGNFFILIGNPNHPEVIGTSSRCKKTQVINSIEEAKNLIFERKIPKNKCVVASQTTFDDEKFNNICNFLEKNIKNLRIYNTICNDSLKRRKEILTISNFSNFVIVIGSTKSSNSKRLFEFSRKLNCNSVMIESPQEFKMSLIKNSKRIFISSGASVLKETVLDLVKIIKNKCEENKIKVNLKKIF